MSEGIRKWLIDDLKYRINQDLYSFGGNCSGVIPMTGMRDFLMPQCSGTILPDIYNSRIDVRDSLNETIASQIKEIENRKTFEKIAEVADQQKIKTKTNW